jgi:CRP/FNR family cyclic AMP-dependent transcriptional regulator
MILSDMVSELASHSFLKGLSPEQLEALSKIATRAQFKAGKAIFHQRETADRFYLIEQGRVSLDYGLPRKGHVQIQTIGPGEALGWSWLAEPYQWQFSATAIDDVTVSSFRVSDLREQCARDPILGYAIMERIAQVLRERLQATRHKLLVYVERASGDEETQQVC